MFTSVLRELEEELGTSAMQYLDIFTTPTIQHTYRITRKGNSYRGWNVETNLFEAHLSTDIIPTEKIELRYKKISATNILEPEHKDAILLITPEEMIRRHNNNRGARVHRGTSSALPYLAEVGNPFRDNHR